MRVREGEIQMDGWIDRLDVESDTCTTYVYTVHIHLQTPGFRFAPLLLTDHSQLLRGTCAACLIHVLGSACQSGNPFKEVYSTISSFHQMTKGQVSAARVASQNRIGWNSFRVPKALCGLGSHRTAAPQGE